MCRPTPTHCARPGAPREDLAHARGLARTSLERGWEPASVGGVLRGSPHPTPCLPDPVGRGALSPVLAPAQPGCYRQSGAYPLVDRPDALPRLHGRLEQHPARAEDGLRPGRELRRRLGPARRRHARIRHPATTQHRRPGPRRGDHRARRARLPDERGAPRRPHGAHPERRAHRAGRRPNGGDRPADARLSRRGVPRRPALRPRHVCGSPLHRRD